jgi:ABC-type transport system substrate-binding protein
VTEAKVLPDMVSFMMRPDRLSPDQRPYNPYQVAATFDNCRIKTLTVIEYIAWE